VGGGGRCWQDSVHVKLWKRRRGHATRKVRQRDRQNAVFSSICDGDLSIALKEAIDKFGQACESFSGPR
jgi:hypothetical protein